MAPDATTPVTVPAALTAVTPDALTPVEPPPVPLASTAVGPEALTPVVAPVATTPVSPDASTPTVFLARIACAVGVVVSGTATVRTPSVVVETSEVGSASASFGVPISSASPVAADAGSAPTTVA